MTNINPSFEMFRLQLDFKFMRSQYSCALWGGITFIRANNKSTTIQNYEYNIRKNTTNSTVTYIHIYIYLYSLEDTKIVFPIQSKCNAVVAAVTKLFDGF